MPTIICAAAAFCWSCLPLEEPYRKIGMAIFGGLGLVFLALCFFGVPVPGCFAH